MALLKTMGPACLALILFQALWELCEPNLIELGAGNVTLCQMEEQKSVLCDSDENCTNAIVPAVDARGFHAPNGTAGTVGCTCYRFGNQLSFCSIVPPDPEYDMDMGAY
uniref:Putative conserved secreted protein n=1 Tax=Amblyomma tuberculatum TaxID=48802 RepID=A0A6M2E1K2_9ACAR